MRILYNLRSTVFVIHVFIAEVKSVYMYFEMHLVRKKKVLLNRSTSLQIYSYQIELSLLQKYPCHMILTGEKATY